MNERKQEQAEGAEKMFRPKLTFYHANAKGTGGVIRLELHPAHDQVDGSIMLTMANQLTVGNPTGANPTFPRFDWENKVVVKLDFSDLCHILQVFRGECESLEGDRGLCHRTAQATTTIQLRHLVEPTAGYSLDLHRIYGGNSQKPEMRCHFFIRDWESVGITEAIAGSMSVIGFGIPMVIPHDTAAYEAENRRFRNERAA